MSVVIVSRHQVYYALESVTSNNYSYLLNSHSIFSPFSLPSPKPPTSHAVPFIPSCLHASLLTHYHHKFNRNDETQNQQVDQINP